MTSKRLTLFNVILLLLSVNIHAQTVTQEKTTSYTIETAGNSWLINNPQKTSEIISSDGITNWTSHEQIIRTYFHLEKPGKVNLSLNVKVDSDNSKIKISLGSREVFLDLNNHSFQKINLGSFNIKESGYHFIELEGITKEGSTYADVKSFGFNTESNQNAIHYIADDFYFGRRGPSTHLLFKTPPEVEGIEWFYNEIEIAENQDVIGSYFMACGFSGGYFGVQVNSETERRILFSIWSPYKTDDPKSIPEEYRIKLLKKGINVTTGKFGNEGSGGQSFKVFPWKTKTRYRFLVHAKPTINQSTDYTAFFYDPEKSKWSLIASFRKPKTHSYLKRLYSFLENFIPNTGVLPRQGGFYNQWICDSKGKWHEITNAEFSADATAKKKSRLDYSGGLINDGFFLKNCGFTNDYLIIGTPLKRTSLSIPPIINFDVLNNLKQ